MVDPPTSTHLWNGTALVGMLIAIGLVAADGITPAWTVSSRHLFNERHSPQE